MLKSSRTFMDEQRVGVARRELDDWERREEAAKSALAEAKEQAAQELAMGRHPGAIVEAARTEHQWAEDQANLRRLWQHVFQRDHTKIHEISSS